MKADDTLARALADLSARELSAARRARTLALARAQLAAVSGERPPLTVALPAYAASVALLSADAAFVADACVKIGRAFG
jgi:hypothetical protein